MAVTLASRPAFARMHGVSKAAVQKWEKRGAVVVVDGKISVEASDRLLMHAGLGRFSDRPRKPQTLEVEGRRGALDTDASGPVGDGSELEEGIAPAANLLVAYFNRICAHAALSAWEVGASVEVARDTDQLFRVMAMAAATDLLDEIGFEPPAGFATWEDAPIWDPERMARIDWSAVERSTPNGEPAT